MKAELTINTDELADTISEKVIRRVSTKESKQNDVVFTVDSLAQYLAVSKQWVYERVHLNEIPFSKMGKLLRFQKSEIDKWLTSIRTPAVNHISSQLEIVK